MTGHESTGDSAQTATSWFHQRESCAPRDVRMWLVGVHVSYGWLTAPAVVDDFGRLVLVGPLQ